KSQLVLLCREWFMHPNGQLPAYEWAFGDVNPPVHAWAALRVFEIDGSKDHAFLERIFHKLLLNFTWWVNRKDSEGNNVYEDGFYYDVFHVDDGRMEPSRAHSLVGLVPLLAVSTIGPETLGRLKEFNARTEWFIHQRPDLNDVIQHIHDPGHAGWRMLSIV